MRRLIFHIGHSKTGSTSIQHALHAGLARHPRQRLLFPGRHSHMELALTLRRSADAAAREERFAALNLWLQRHDWDVAVVSSEQFEHYPPERLRDAIAAWLPDFAGQVQVVAYVRPHVDRLVANHAEALKLGFFFDGLADYHRQQKLGGLLFYHRRLSAWRSVFGDALTVQPMLPERLYQGDVVQDFFRLVFGDADFALADPGRQNEALSWTDLTVLREFNRRILDRSPGLRPPVTAFAWHAAPILAALPPARRIRPGIDAALLAEVQAAYAADAQDFDADFCGGAPLFADALSAAADQALDAPLPVEAAAYFDAETLRLVHAFADILHRAMASGDPLFTRLLAQPRAELRLAEERTEGQEDPDPAER